MSDGQGSDGGNGHDARPERSRDGHATRRQRLPQAGNGAPPGSNRGGGPKTAAGLARCAEAAMTRGGLYVAWRDRVLPACTRCPQREECHDCDLGERCPQMARAMDAIYDDVMEAGHITILSEPLVREYAYCVAMLERVDIQIAAEGMFQRDMKQPSGSKPSGLMDLRMRVAGRVDRGAAELGLTPSSQARAGMKAVGDGMSDLAEALRGLNERRGQEAGPRVVAAARDQGVLEGIVEEDGGDLTPGPSPAGSLRDPLGEGSTAGDD